MKNLYLIGMMSCGKSTCGKLLSEQLGRPLLDTDTCIQEKAGKTVSEIFAESGEEHFRDLETELCRELSEKTGLIVACGGGLPLRQENRELLQQSGRVFFLRRDPGKSYDGGDMSARPLGQAGREDFLRRFAQREPLYRAAAHHIIGDYDTPQETVAAILNLWEEEL